MGRGDIQSRADAHAERAVEGIDTVVIPVEAMEQIKSAIAYAFKLGYIAACDDTAQDIKRRR